MVPIVGVKCQLEVSVGVSPRKFAVIAMEGKHRLSVLFLAQYFL